MNARKRPGRSTVSRTEGRRTAFGPLFFEADERRLDSHRGCTSGHDLAIVEHRPACASQLLSFSRRARREFVATFSGLAAVIDFRASGSAP